MAPIFLSNRSIYSGTLASRPSTITTAYRETNDCDRFELGAFADPLRGRPRVEEGAGVQLSIAYGKVREHPSLSNSGWRSRGHMARMHLWRSCLALSCTIKALDDLLGTPKRFHFEPIRPKRPFFASVVNRNNATSKPVCGSLDSTRTLNPPVNCDPQLA